MLKIYKISRGYRQLTIYRGNLNGSLVSTRTVTPDKDLLRVEKYMEMYRVLSDEGIVGPPYFPTKKEEKFYPPNTES